MLFAPTETHSSSDGEFEEGIVGLVVELCTDYGYCVCICHIGVVVVA